MSDDKMIDASFDVIFTVPLHVRNINDAVINQGKVVEAAKAAACEECIRQLNEAVGDGAFDIAED